MANERKDRTQTPLAAEAAREELEQQKTGPVPQLRSRSTRAAQRGSRHFHLLLGLLVLLAVGLVAAGAFAWTRRNAAADVTVYQVKARDATQYIGGGGMIFPLQQLNVSYPFPERVVAVLVKPGDQVAPDQPLIQLDTSQLNAQIKQAFDNMKAAKAYLDSVSAGGNTVTIAQAQQQYNLAQNRYNALVAQSASSLLHNGNLISPMNGVVTVVNVNPNQVVAADTPLLTIMDESSVIVRVKIPLEDLSMVHPGQAALVTPSALPNHDFNGTVSSVIPQADPQTDTFEVWVKVANANKSLLPGMNAFVRIPLPLHAFIVPRLAVLNPDRESIVFVVRHQRAYIQHVQVVGHTGDAVIVGQGLSEGDDIVLIGMDQLQNGQAVHFRGSA
ncbi:MAG: efflux RND transporter periplasmic adaptor subunit [Ktedonobacteraceae bacterium]|nr:efflux RND transporter periplasmic adaptor subunit [Ktedonobacteraceae bacterium]